MQSNMNIKADKNSYKYTTFVRRAFIKSKIFYGLKIFFIQTNTTLISTINFFLWEVCNLYSRFFFFISNSIIVGKLICLQ